MYCAVFFGICAITLWTSKVSAEVTCKPGKGINYTVHFEDKNINCKEDDVIHMRIKNDPRVFKNCAVLSHSRIECWCHGSIQFDEIELVRLHDNRGKMADEEIIAEYELYDEGFKQFYCYENHDPINLAINMTNDMTGFFQWETHHWDDHLVDGVDIILNGSRVSSECSESCACACNKNAQCPSYSDPSERQCKFNITLGNVHTGGKDLCVRLHYILGYGTRTSCMPLNKNITTVKSRKTENVNGDVKESKKTIYILTGFVPIFIIQVAVIVAIMRAKRKREKERVKHEQLMKDFQIIN